MTTGTAVTMTTGTAGTTGTTATEAAAGPAPSTAAAAVAAGSAPSTAPSPSTAAAPSTAPARPAPLAAPRTPPPAAPRTPPPADAAATLAPGGLGSCAHPTEQHGTTLVVFEGGRRMRWSRPGPGRWRPVGVWPGAAEAAALAGYLAARGNLLVVLDRAEPTVSLLAEELAGAPAAVRRLLPATAPEPDDPVVDVGIPALDWLPAPLRLRGLRFLARATEAAERTPALLLPALLTDEPDPERPHVRFALRTGPHGIGGARLTAVVADLFAAAPAPRHA
ncbi:hypothetical protein [Streptomyces sp. enrichment culture]|uniref:hypothetical protein n=1 Tax=Streptomyces sp. enrichment culture TaxID=1795815 RepID=UPI003F563D14